METGKHEDETFKALFLCALSSATSIMVRDLTQFLCFFFLILIYLLPTTKCLQIIMKGKGTTYPQKYKRKNSMHGSY